MALFRRKASDPTQRAAREAFLRIAVMLDTAQRALLSTVPTARSAGTPLAEALDDFIGRLSGIEAEMPEWRTDQTEEPWTRCSEALVLARAEAERLRAEPGRLGFEALNARLGDVISPLEEFADVARALRD